LQLLEHDEEELEKETMVFSSLVKETTKVENRLRQVSSENLELESELEKLLKEIQEMEQKNTKQEERNDDLLRQQNALQSWFAAELAKSQESEDDAVQRAIESFLAVGGNILLSSSSACGIQLTRVDVQCDNIVGIKLVFQNESSSSTSNENHQHQQQKKGNVSNFDTSQLLILQSVLNFSESCQTQQLLFKNKDNNFNSSFVNLFAIVGEEERTFTPNFEFAVEMMKKQFLRTQKQIQKGTCETLQIEWFCCQVDNFYPVSINENDEETHVDGREEEKYFDCRVSTIQEKEKFYLKFRRVKKHLLHKVGIIAVELYF
jgi:hypothetical protein